MDRMIVCRLPKDHIAANRTESAYRFEMPYLSALAHVAVSAHAKRMIRFRQSNLNIAQSRMLLHDQLRLRTNSAEVLNTDTEPFRLEFLESI
jgi:hypothetical protein